MNSKWRFQIAAVSCLAAAPTSAEITLEETGETLTGDMEITQDMGITRGTNLLHSFLTFNVNAGETATFSGSNDISNIIARVNGDSASQIDGLLRSTISRSQGCHRGPVGFWVWLSAQGLTRHSALLALA